MKTDVSKKWNAKADAYSKMASSKEADAYEYDINFPSILNLCPTEVTSVLDLGCGDGGFTKILANKYSKVVGADVSPRMVDIAKSNFPEIDFIVADLDDQIPTFDETFDLVIMKLVLMFVENLENVAEQLGKVTHIGAFVIVSVPHPTYWTAYYLQDKYGYKERHSFRVLEKGYFTEKTIEKPIGGDKELVFGFIHRTLSTYVNTFSKFGFLVDKVDEPQLTEGFLAKYPEDSNKKDIPMRLNIRFKKI